MFTIYSSEQPGFQNVQPLIPDISIEEVKRAIQEQKSCKALGEDGITFEVIRAGGQIIEDTKKQTDLMNMERIKNSRRMERGCYYSYTHKGDKQGCDNYRGISFLNTELHTYKIYSYPQVLKMSVISN